MHERSDFCRVSQDDIMGGFPVPRARRVTPETIYRAPYTRWFMQHVREVVGTATVSRGGCEVAAFPTELRDLDKWRLHGVTGPTLAEVLRDTQTDAFLVLHKGVIVDEQYFFGMTPETPHMWQSVSKSLASCVAGNLVDRGLIDLDEKVTTYVPELECSAYAGALVRHLLDMQVGIAYAEDYDDPDSDASQLDRLCGLRPARNADEPGSSYEFAVRSRKRGTDGEVFHYVSLNTNVLAWVMERVTGVRMPELIRLEVWDKLGTEHEAYIALDGAGSAQSEGGFCSSLRDLGRFGQALCQNGRFNGQQVVPRWWINDVVQGGDRKAFARSAVAATMPRDSWYRNCFWVIESPDQPVFMGLGIYGETLYVDPGAEVVIAKYSTQPVADDTKAGQQEFMMFKNLAASFAECR